MTRSSSIAPHTSIVRREARALAAAIDLVVVALIGVCFVAAAVAAMLIQVNPLERDPTAGEGAVGYAVFLLWVPAVAIYAGLGSRTIGARLLRLQMTSNTKARAIIRGVMWWPSLLILGAGLWWPWIDARGRSLTDIVSRTSTVETLHP